MADTPGYSQRVCKAMLPKEPSTVGLEGIAIHRAQGVDTLRNGFYTCPACGVPHRDGGDSKASTSLKHPTHQAWGLTGCVYPFAYYRTISSCWSLNHICRNRNR